MIRFKTTLMLAAIIICCADIFTSCKKENNTGNPISDSTPKKALLVILDGWGIGDQGEDDAIANTPTPYIDYLNATYPHSQLQASGEYVGLPDGQMGNSETGHLNIGAGRVIYQDLVMINHACDDNSILQNPEIQSAYSYAQSTGKSLHLMGLTSDGGVHSSIDHLFKLIDIAAQYNIENCYVHCFMDGRDTDPMSGKGFVIDLQQHMAEAGTGVVATVIGRYYAMDRAKEMTIALTQHDIPEQDMQTISNLQYYCMTPYDDSFTGIHVIFPKGNVENTLGEYIASKGLKQLHAAETEKYAHVTSFINVGREEPFEGEDRILVNSPAVATYDLQPEMSAYELKDRLIEALNTNRYDWIVVNFANADMVGHTGVYSAIQTAVQTIDQCLSELVEAAKAKGYEVVITADHGNADHAINDDGTPNTAHSTNPVPFIYVTENSNARVQNGVLADVAPTILHIMGLQQPQEMTGQCLISQSCKTSTF